MSRLLVVDDLVSQVRAMMDEQNRDTLSDSVDILPALNRAQDYAWDIYARHYPEPLLQTTFFDTEAGVSEYDMPEDLFEDRVLKVEMDSGRGVFYEVRREKYSRLSELEGATSLNIPYGHAIIGRKIKFAPPTSGAYRVRLWSLREVETLVPSWGRVTKVSTSGSYIRVGDADGSELTTESDNLDSYFNVVDGQTGEIRATLQAKYVSDGRIVIKTIPQRSTVLNRTIATSLEDIVQEDDYICSIQGVCVPYFAKPTTNFMIQYAVAELRRKLGGNADLEQRVLDDFTEQVERTWVSREHHLRVKSSSSIWGARGRRSWWRGTGV